MKKIISKLQVVMAVCVALVRDQYWHVRFDTWMGHKLHVLFRGHFDVQIKEWYNKKYPPYTIKFTKRLSEIQRLVEHPMIVQNSELPPLRFWGAGMEERVDHEQQGDWFDEAYNHQEMRILRGDNNNNNNNNNQGETPMNIKYFDTSTLEDLPDAATYMAEAEQLYIFVWPEPEHTTDEDGNNIILGTWCAEVAVKDALSYRHQVIVTNWIIGVDEEISKWSICSSCNGAGEDRYEDICQFCGGRGEVLNAVEDDFDEFDDTWTEEEGS